MPGVVLMSPPMHGAKTLTELIGNTPLIQLESLSSDLPENIQFLIKAEWYNPAGSVKDRAAWGIVQKAMAENKLKAGGKLLDSSSGNTGIAYAMLGAKLGFEVHLCIPKNANIERKQMLRAYDTKLIFTDPAEGSDGAIIKAKELMKENPGEYFYADQYSNEANWRAHYEGTGPELVEQTGGSLTHFIVGLGTTGTCMGTGRYLREKHPSAKVIAFQPDSPFHGLEGMKHLETAIVPAIYDSAVPHQQRECRTESAHAMARRVAREEGLLVGISGGAAIHVGLQVAREEAKAGREATIVCLVPDGGTRYLNDNFWGNDSED